MSDQNFGPLLAFSDVEGAILEHNKKWLDTWLNARERKVGLEERTLARPRSYIIKQTFTALPGQEQTPLVIVVSDGFRSEPLRRGDGHYIALFRVGVACMCQGVDNGTNQVRELVGHYQAALLGVALKHQKVNEYIQLHELVDLKIDDVDEEAIGRSFSAVRLEMTYRVNNFAEEFDPPLKPDPPPPDPVEPHPDDPEVLSVFTNVEDKT